MRATRWRRICGHCVSFGMMGAALVLPRVASADGPRYRVELHAPKYLPNCNDLEGFLEELDLSLGHSLLGSPATRVLDVRIERPIGSAFVVDIVIADLDGHVLRKQSETYSGSMECFKVLHRVAFDAAMEMEKDVPDEPEARTAPATPTCTPPPPPPPPPPLNPPSPAKAAPPKRGYVGLGIGAFLNVAPEAFFAPHVRLGWYVRPRVALELDVAGQAWTTRPNDGPTAIDVNTGLATIAGCYAPASFLLCGLFSTELRHTSSREQLTETKILPSLGLRASYDHELMPSLSLRTNLDAFIYLRDRNIESRTTTLWQPIPLATNLVTSLVWTF